MPSLPDCYLSMNSLVTNAAEELFRRLGITFAVYAEGGPWPVRWKKCSP